jgi:hypothetical protein
MKSYTDIEQSKKLAEILPHESADMLILNNVGRSGDVDGTNCHTILKENLNPLAEVPEILPCWSLAALLNVMKESELIGSPEGTWLNRVWYKGFPISRGGYNNPVDACVAMIIKLHEQNLL